MTNRRIGKFEILEQLGQGAMGVVYRARDVRLDREVALKLLLPDRTLDETSRRRFLRECRAVAALNHPNIATLYEADEAEDGTLYFAAELVGGKTLSSRLRKGPIPLDRLLDYGTQLAAALAAAHGRGIIHRDIKPANLMITGQHQLKVLDFGLARSGVEPDVPDADAETQEATVTQAGAVIGTPSYMAPEQVAGRDLGPAADVFAAGVVLYEMATGHRAFRGDSTHDTYWLILHEDPTPVTERNRRLPRALAAIIGRCLQKDPGDRYQNGTELRAALAEAQSGGTFARWRSWAAAAMAALVVVAGLWWSQQGGLAFSSQDRLLIANVSNETSESVFSGALGAALEVDLRQSRYALVVGRREVVEALGLTRRALDTPLDVETALDLARWVRAKAVLVPTIRQVDDTYQLEAVVYATATGNPVETVSVIADGKDAVLRSAVDELTAVVRERLGESLDQIEQNDAPIVRVTTASWDALEALQNGVTAADVGRHAEAVAFLEEALEKDPEFTAAKAELGLILIQFLGEPDRGRDLLAETALEVDGLSDFERVMLDGLTTQFVDGDLVAALEQFRVAATLFPERSEPYRNQGVLLRALGRYAEAAEALHEAHARQPRSSGPLRILWFLQVGPLRDATGAEDTARQLVDLQADNADFLHMLGWSYVTQMLFADAEQQMEEILDLQPDFARAQVNLAHLVLRGGDAERAVPLYREVVAGVEAGRIAENLPVARLWLSVALHSVGDNQEADALLEAVLDEHSQAGASTSPQSAAFRGQFEAARGRTQEALSWLAGLPATEDLDGPTAHMAAAAYAMLGERDRALEALAHVLRLQPWGPYYFLILPDFRNLWDDPAFVRLVTTGELIL